MQLSLLKVLVIFIGSIIVTACMTEQGHNYNTTPAHIELQQIKKERGIEQEKMRPKQKNHLYQKYQSREFIY